MRLSEFEDQVRAGFAPAESSSRVSAMIDRRLFDLKQKRAKGRRISFALAATAVLAVCLTVAPTVRAYAALRRLAGALDNVQSVVMTRENVGPDGTWQSGGRIAYLNGKWRIDMPGQGLSYFQGGQSYRLDLRTHQFVVESGLSGPFGHNTSDVRLSALLGQMQSWLPRHTLEIDKAELHGKTMTRATIEDLNFKSRMTIYADATSDLPVEMDSEDFKGGAWKLASRSTFDYASKQNPADFMPDLKTYPPISKQQWSSELVGSLAKNDLGSVKFSGGRLVVRSIDVAQNGTVFVSCQAGEKIPMWDRGYPVDVSDSLGGKYALMYVSSRLDKEFISASSDGKLELCVFVPLEPVAEWTSRTILVSTRLDSHGKLARHLQSMSCDPPDMTIDSYSWYYDQDIKTTTVATATLTAKKPTCDLFPDYASIVNPEQFVANPKLEADEAKARADYYRYEQDYASERLWLNEAIRIGSLDDESMAARRLVALNRYEERLARRRSRR